MKHRRRCALCMTRKKTCQVVTGFGQTYTCVRCLTGGVECSWTFHPASAKKEFERQKNVFNGKENQVASKIYLFPAPYSLMCVCDLQEPDCDLQAPTSFAAKLTSNILCVRAPKAVQYTVPPNPPHPLAVLSLHTRALGATVRAREEKWGEAARAPK